MDVVISLLALLVLFGCLAGPVLLVRAWWRRQVAPPPARAAVPPGHVAGPGSSTGAPVQRPPVPTGDAEQRESGALIDGLVIGHLWTRAEYRDRLAAQEAATAQARRDLERQQELAELGGTEDPDPWVPSAWGQDEELDELDQFEEDDAALDAGLSGLWEDGLDDDEY